MHRGKPPLRQLSTQGAQRVAMQIHLLSDLRCATSHAAPWRQTTTQLKGRMTSSHQNDDAINMHQTQHERINGNREVEDIRKQRIIHSIELTTANFITEELATELQLQKRYLSPGESLKFITHHMRLLHKGQNSIKQLKPHKDTQLLYHAIYIGFHAKSYNRPQKMSSFHQILRWPILISIKQHRYRCSSARTRLYHSLASGKLGCRSWITTQTWYSRNHN